MKSYLKFTLIFVGIILIPVVTQADEVLPSNTSTLIIPSNTLNTIKGLNTLETLDTILVPIKKETIQLPSSNCPKPIQPKKRGLQTIFTPNPDVSLKNINHESGLDPNYIPDDLVDISSSIKTVNNTTICLSRTAAAALVAMAKDMDKQGLSLSVNSGFRSYYAQQKLYQSYAPTAKNVAFPRVAREGHSEHQLGTVIDVKSELNPGTFALSSESDWLHNNAHQYGFIISYPENGEEKTGFMYEPWHLRYVGRENAMLLHEANYTLAYKPVYYKQSSLTKLLSSLKNKFGMSSGSLEIGG